MDVSKIYTKVEEAIKKKNFDFAIEMLKNQILKFNPNDVKARRLLRVTVLEKYKVNGFPSQSDILSKGLVPQIKMVVGKLFKKWEMVVDEAENYLQYDPKNTRVLFLLGEACMQAGYVDTAIAVLENIISLNSAHVNAIKTLGKIYYEHKKDMEKASQLFQRVARLAPHDIDAGRLVKDISAQMTASTYAQADSSRDLIKDKDKARELEEDNQKLRTEEDIQRAIERTRQKLTQDPNNRKELRRVAELYQKLGKYDQAIDYLNKLLQQDPTNFDTKCKIGDCKLRKLEQQVRTMRENVKKAPQNQAIKQKLQQVLQEKNNFQIEEYQMRSANQPNNSEMRFKLGYALFQAKRFDESIANFQRAIEDPRSRVASYNYMGQAFTYKKEFELAVEQYDSALNLLNPNDSQYRDIKYNLAAAYEYAQNYQKALDTFMEIYKVDIGYKDVGDRVSKLREKMG